MMPRILLLLFLCLCLLSSGCRELVIAQGHDGRLHEATLFSESEEGPRRPMYRMVFDNEGYVQEFFADCGAERAHLCRVDSEQWPVTIKPSATRGSVTSTAQGILYAAKLKRWIAADAPDIMCLFLGDSIFGYFRIEGIGLPVWQERFAPRNCFNAGSGGERAENLLLRMSDEGGLLNENLPQEAVFLITVGTNNLGLRNAPGWPAWTEEEIAEEVGIQIALGNIAALARIRAFRPEAHVIFVEIIPQDPQLARISLRKANKIIAQAAQLQNVWSVDLFDLFLNPDGTRDLSAYTWDGIHPSTKGYNIMADALEGALDILSIREKIE